jgi:hypothetical protein
MSRVCSVTGAKPKRGSTIHRRGMAKKKGGVVAAVRAGNEWREGKGCQERLTYSLVKGIPDFIETINPRFNG